MDDNMPWGNEEDVDRIVRKKVKEALARERAKTGKKLSGVPERARRHDEEAYENLRTLDALTKTGDRSSARIWAVLRLMTRLRLERPELWEEIKQFAKN